MSYIHVTLVLIFCRNEEEALNLLFLGDTNRMISSTPMNMASSRSHCIFTANVEARKVGEDTVLKSKLHLVDLAGSERVSKTGVDGQVYGLRIFGQCVWRTNHLTNECVCQWSRGKRTTHFLVVSILI